MEKTISFRDIDVGMTFGPSHFRVTEEAIAAYRQATGDQSPAPADGAAPPTFAALFTPLRAILGVTQIKGGVHFKQEYTFRKPVRPGDQLTTTAKVVDKYVKKNRTYRVVETVTKNQNGEEVVLTRHTGFIPREG